MSWFEILSLIVSVIAMVISAIACVLTYNTIKTTKNIQRENFQIGLFEIRTDVYYAFEKLCQLASCLVKTENFHFDNACIYTFNISENDRNATSIDIAYEDYRNKAMLAEISFSEDVYSGIAPLCLQLQKVKQHYNEILLCNAEWEGKSQLISDLIPCLEYIESNQIAAKMRNEMKVLLNRKLSYLK